MLIKKLITFSLMIISMPVALFLFLLNLVCGVIIGLSSLITNMAAGLFFFGSVAGWIIGANPVQIWHCFGIGLFFMIAPHIANVIISKATGLLNSITNYVLK